MGNQFKPSLPRYPYWTGLHGPLSPYFQPPIEDLPPGGQGLPLSFQWGAGSNASRLVAMDSQEQTINLGDDLVIWGIHGSFDGAGVFLQIIHIHNGKQRRLCNKPRPLDSICGNGQNPHLLTPTWPMKASDSIMVQVKSLDRVNPQNVEVVLLANLIKPYKSPVQQSVLERGLIS